MSQNHPTPQNTPRFSRHTRKSVIGDLRKADEPDKNTRWRGCERAAYFKRFPVQTGISCVFASTICELEAILKMLHLVADINNSLGWEVAINHRSSTHACVSEHGSRSLEASVKPGSGSGLKRGGFLRTRFRPWSLRTYFMEGPT